MTPDRLAERLSYSQMLWIGFFPGQYRSRFASWFDLFISPASEARFIKAAACTTAGYPGGAVGFSTSGGAVNLVRVG